MAVVGQLVLLLCWPVGILRRSQSSSAGLSALGEGVC